MKTKPSVVSLDKSTFVCYTNKEVSERLQFGQGCLVVLARPKRKRTHYLTVSESHVSGFFIDLTTYLWYNTLK